MGARTRASQHYRVQAVDRAIDCLKAFSQEQPELTLAEVAARTRLSKPTAFRLLATLQVRGFVSRSGSKGSYSLGSEIQALAAIRAQQSSLLDRALPVMRRIRDTVNETTAISVRAGDYRVHLYQLESLQPIRRSTELGARSPLYAGASNRVLLAGMSDTEIADYLARVPLIPFTPRTITDPHELWREIQRTRERGYAESRSERDLGADAFAAPIRDATGVVIASLYISVPESRYTQELRTRCIKLVVDGAGAISEELGYRTQGPEAPESRLPSTLEPQPSSPPTRSSLPAVTPLDRVSKRS